MTVTEVGPSLAGVNGGIKTCDMSDFHVTESVKLSGTYIVCASGIRFHVREFISIGESSKSVLAGDSIDLCAPQISLQGGEQDPVEIVAISNLNIEADTLRIKNVAFYLLQGINLSLNSSNAEIANVRVFTIECSDRTLQYREVALCNSGLELADALRNASEHPNRLEMRGQLLEGSSEVWQDCIERLEWQREIVQKIGLRTILCGRD
jgi:hypothetical protein